LSPINTQTISLILPQQRVISDAMRAGLHISCRILGSRKIVREPVIPYAIFDKELIVGDLVRKEPNMDAFDFLTVDEVNRIIRIKVGTHKLDNDLIIPKGYQVYAIGGTELDLTNNANILSYSPLQWIGNEKSLISCYSSDSTAQGITVINTKEESHLDYVNFNNLANPMKSGWNLTSAITFYESPVEIDHCLFENNRRGDDYLNIVRCTFSIDHTLFLNCHADAFDGDFTQGTIRNSRFINSGNDAIDVSGSNLDLQNILIDGTGDKGVSAGEESTLNLHDIRINNAEIAVTSKDYSTILIEDIEIKDSQIAYTAFQKKSEFGPGRIEVLGNSLISGRTEIPYLIEDKSTMRMADKPVRSSVDVKRVKQILYGVKYGKSSQ